MRKSRRRDVASHFRPNTSLFGFCLNMEIDGHERRRGGSCERVLRPYFTSTTSSDHTQPSRRHRFRADAGQVYMDACAIWHPSHRDTAKTEATQERVTAARVARRNLTWSPSTLAVSFLWRAHVYVGPDKTRSAGGSGHIVQHYTH